MRCGKVQCDMLSFNMLMNNFLFLFCCWCLLGDGDEKMEVMHNTDGKIDKFFLRVMEIKIVQWQHVKIKSENMNKRTKIVILFDIT